MSSSVRALIDLSALRHNIQRVRDIAKNQRILAIVKANAYGHGAKHVCHAIQNFTDAFGVTSFEEAIELREAHIHQPILIMSRFWNSEQLQYCSEYHLSLVLHQLYQIDILEKNPQTVPLNVWLKLETGMHRLGFSPTEFQQAWSRLSNLAWIQKPLGIMTHFACADNPNDSLTDEQIRCFDQITQDYPGPKSMANSAAILSRPQTLADWVRPGIMLYGSSPFPKKTAQDCGLRTVMTLSAPIIAIRQLQKGDNIGYGATWRCEKDMLMAVIAIGYADGYPRHAPNGTPVWINGQICHLVGRVSMDLITVDLHKLINIKIGDRAILWGPELPIDQIAALSQTISYELFCKITDRVEFIAHE